MASSEYSDSKHFLLAPARLLMILIPATIFPFVAMLYHFLKEGAYFLDSGYFGYLLTQADWLMHNPPVLGEGKYIATHVSPSFWPMQILSQSLGLLPQVAVGIWQSLIFLCVAVAGILFIDRSPLAAEVRRSRWTFATALLMPFSGLALSILIYPHTEALAMSGLFLTIALWFEKSRGAHILAWVIFIATLGVREDVGFHVFALMMTFLVLAWWCKRTPSSWKSFLAAALIGFAYSFAILKVQKANFSGDDAFARIYSGHPPWAHLNAGFLVQRFLQMLIHKPYLSLPGLIYVIYALRRKNILMATPLLAYLPWVFVNLSAVAPTAGSLMSYYAYPLLSLFIWPVVLLRLQAHQMTSPQQREMIALCVTMLAVSVLGFRSSMGRRIFHWMNPIHLSLLWDGTYEEHRCVVEKFLKNGRGRNMMGPQFGALFPADYSKAEVFFEPSEAIDKDYVMIWKNGYFVDKLENDVGIQENFVKYFSDDSVNVIWKRKTAPEPIVPWSQIFAPCRTRSSHAK